MDSFENMMKAACHIKSYQMSFDKKVFEKLPEFYKTGLYCCEMLKNVHLQKEFHLKVAAYDVHKTKGIELISRGNYDDAHYSFCKALCIFKFIKNKNKNWKNEGIKDEELEFIEEDGSNPEERALIKNMKISALLNIALCDLNMEKYSEVRLGCDEVIKIDSNNIKAYYRKARSYLDCKSSTLDDYHLALKELEIANRINPNNEEISSLYKNLRAFVNKQKTEEKKVFKSFFRKVNYQSEENLAKEANLSNNNTNASNNFYTQITDQDANLGKPEIRILNLVIEQCYVLMDRLEREGNRIEVRKMKAIAEKATVYKEDLQKLLELNFENPNDNLKEFALKNNLDLKDPNVKNEFFKIRKNYLDQINKFYEDNLLKVNPNDILNANNDKQTKKVNRTKVKKQIKKDDSDKTPKKQEKEVDKLEQAKNIFNERKIQFNFPLLGIILLMTALIYYLVFNKNHFTSDSYDEY